MIKYFFRSVSSEECKTIIKTNKILLQVVCKCAVYRPVVWQIECRWPCTQKHICSCDYGSQWQSWLPLWHQSRRSTVRTCPPTHKRSRWVPQELCTKHSSLYHSSLWKKESISLTHFAFRDLFYFSFFKTGQVSVYEASGLATLSGFETAHIEQWSRLRTI